MTRTERSVSPRAVKRDRHVSKTGIDKGDRKGGAGRHNWGSLADEVELEREALEDVGLDEGELANVPPDVNGAVRPAVDGPPSELPTSPALNTEEVEKARQTRETGLNGDVDLTTIARTSAGATTSPNAPSLEVTRDADTNAIP